MTTFNKSRILLTAVLILALVFSFTLFIGCKTPETEVVVEESSETAAEEEMVEEEMAEEETTPVDEQTDSQPEEDAEEQQTTEETASYMDISPEEAKKLIDENPDLIIVDVSPKFDEGHIPGAVNYYVGDGSLDEAIEDLDPAAEYLVYCHTDSASIAGAQKLIDAGFENVYRLEGNYSAWVDAGYEVETAKTEETGEEMNITSTAFENNEMIPSEYTCDGDNINPPLSFGGVPSETKSLVLIVDDPDAPGGTWLHWTVWNIDPASTGIDENSVPAGTTEGTTDFGEPGYGGPCPPSGTHRYFFKLYAIDITLDLDSSSSVDDLMSAMEGHILDSSELIGLYERS